MEDGLGRALVVLRAEVPPRKREEEEISPASSVRRKVVGERKEGGEIGSWEPKTGVPAREGRAEGREARGVEERGSLPAEGVVNMVLPELSA